MKKITGRISNIKGTPIFIPNDVFELAESGCYVSYNNHDICIYGDATTAIVRDDGRDPSKFLILNGDHREELYKLRHYDACVEYFKSHLNQKNKFSENWDEELILSKRPDGSVYFQKVKISRKD